MGFPFPLYSAHPFEDGTQKRLMRGKKSAVLTVVTADQISGAMQTNEGEDEKDVI